MRLYLDTEIDLSQQKESISRSVSDLTEAFTAIAGILNARFDLFKHYEDFAFLNHEQKNDSYLIDVHHSLWIKTGENNNVKKTYLQQLISACNMQEDDLILYTV